MFGWCKKVSNWLTSGYDFTKPKAKATVVSVKDLQYKTKKELEKIGRKI